MHCPTCNFDNPDGMRFCGGCGSPLAPAAGESSGVVAERRQLTVLFCDLVGSTELSERLDPEDLHQLVLAYQASAAAVVERFEGHVAQYLGDGLLVYFGFPQAHEDDARRAIHAGLAIVRAVAELSDRLERERGFRLAVRVGIHTGDVVTGEVGGGSRREHLALGRTPNVAARLQGLAEPNRVVVSAATHQLARGFFAFRPLGPQTLKGISRPVKVYQALREHDVHDRFELAARGDLLPLVGRGQELDALRRRFRAAQDHHGQMVLIVGEAGIGKSRLVHGLREHVEVDGCTWLICRCSPYARNTAFYPLVGLARKMLRLTESDDPREAIGKIESALAPTELPANEVVPLFAELLAIPLNGDYQPPDLSPPRQKQRILEGLLALLLLRSGQRPVVLVMEDLHWVDPSSLEFLELLLSRIASARLLTLLTSRPSFRPPWDNGRPYLTRLQVERIGSRETESLITRLASGKTLPHEVIRHLLERTDGNPLFVEEITRAVLQSDLLTERGDHYELTRPLSSRTIPTTLRDSLAARLDTLEAAKEVAQLAAAIGRTFTLNLLSAVSSLDHDTLQRALDRLIEAQIILPIETSLSRSAYVFKHALIQDAAYDSLLRATRQQYHRRIAETLAAEFHEVREKQPELLARHFAGAGQPEKAIDYLQAAAAQAMSNSANLEAIAHLEKALELLAPLPDTAWRRRRELELYLAIGAPLAASQGYATAEVERAFQRARELGERSGEQAELFQAVAGLGAIYLVRAELDQAVAQAATMIQIAEAVAQDSVSLYAHFGFGIVQFFRGGPRTAHEHLTLGLGFDQPERGQPWLSSTGEDRGVAARSFLALTEWILGHPDRACEHGRHAVTLAQRIRHPFSLAFALIHTGFVHWFCGDKNVVRDRVEEGLGLVADKGFFNLQPLGEFLRGSLASSEPTGAQPLAYGQGEAWQRMHQALAAWRAPGAAVWQTFFLAELSANCLARGRAEEAVHWLDEGLEAAERTGERFWQAELHRLRGVTLQELAAAGAAGGTEDPAQCFAAAAEIAHRQGARSLELRAAISLNRFLARRGESSAAARARLAEIYGEFTEGFDTADLRAARALLA